MCTNKKIFFFSQWINNDYYFSRILFGLQTQYSYWENDEITMGYHDLKMKFRTYRMNEHKLNFQVSTITDYWKKWLLDCLIFSPFETRGDCLSRKWIEIFKTKKEPWVPNYFEYMMKISRRYVMTGANWQLI